MICPFLVSYKAPSSLLVVEKIISMIFYVAAHAAIGGDVFLK